MTRGGGTYLLEGDRVTFVDSDTGCRAFAFVQRSLDLAKILAWERCRAKVARLRFRKAVARRAVAVEALKIASETPARVWHF